MKTSTRRPVARQLEAYEEQWKSDHNLAMRCRELEDLLDFGVVLFGFIQRIDAEWRADVSGGASDAWPEDEDEYRSLYARFAEMADQVEESIRKYEQRYTSGVRHAAEFRAARETARRSFAAWKSPPQQRAPGLQPVTLTDDEYDRLRRWGQDGSGRLTIEPRSL